MILDLLDNKSHNIPNKIQYLYDNNWSINPMNHKWVKNNVELELNEAYCVQKYRNYNNLESLKISMTRSDII